jgi:ring-1,2-phenylacetyl-CoA epoxidase subunit PaaC
MELLDVAPQSWEDFIVTTWLAEQATWIMAGRLLDDRDRGVSALARKIGEESFFHLKYATGWFSVLADESGGLDRLGRALAVRHPLAADWFGGLPERAAFETVIGATLEPFGLRPAPAPVTGGLDERRRRGDLPQGLHEIIRFSDLVSTA